MKHSHKVFYWIKRKKKRKEKRRNKKEEKKDNISEQELAKLITAWKEVRNWSPGFYQITETFTFCYKDHFISSSFNSFFSPFYISMQNIVKVSGQLIGKSKCYDANWVLEIADS